MRQGGFGNGGHANNNSHHQQASSMQQVLNSHHANPNQQQHQPSQKKGNKGSSNSKQQQKQFQEELNQFADNSSQPPQSYQYKEHKTLSELKLVALTDKGPLLYKLDCSSTQDQVETLECQQDFPQYPTAEIAKFSPKTGQKLAIVDKDGIHVIDIANKRILFQIECKGIASLQWSPMDTYLIGCEKNIQNPNKNNLWVWESTEGKPVAKFDWQNKAQEGAVSIKFDLEEKFAARQIAINVIEVFEKGNFEQSKLQIKSKLPPLPKINGQAQEDNRVDNSRFDGFIFCPVPPENIGANNAACYLMAWQNGEVLSDSEDNGLVYVYDLNSNLQRPKFNIACPRANDIQIIPAPSGHAILVWSQNQNDSTGKSYYGEHSLQYIRIHKGKNRKFIPVFDNQIQDVKWTQDGQQFIVISGQQPAMATMYDLNGEPTFEFGKQFRNTIKICPFSSILMIGGFGNITKGEMNFWNLETQKEIGKAKFPCSIKIQWSPCGRYLLNSVLYERLKVDNGFQIFRANGSKVLMKQETFQELHNVEWQPHEAGLLSKPNIDKLRKEEKKESEQSSKPKRVLKFQQNSAFQQMMRQQMASGTSSSTQGPKKVDQNMYKELAEQQTAKAQQQIQSQVNTFGTSLIPSAKNQQDPSQMMHPQGSVADQIFNPQRFGGGGGQMMPPKKKANDNAPNWRIGKFHNDAEDDMYMNEDGEYQKQENTLFSQIKIQEKPVSKHAARRKRKKAAQVVQQNPPPGGQIITDADPSLDDLK